MSDNFGLISGIKALDDMVLLASKTSFINNTGAIGVESETAIFMDSDFIGNHRVRRSHICAGTSQCICD